MRVDSISELGGAAACAIETVRACTWSLKATLRSIGSVACVLAAVAHHSQLLAQVPSVLIEACSMLEPAAKRIECLQQANQSARSSNGAGSSQGYRPPAPSAPSYLQSAPTPNTSYSAPSGQTCFVGPRGGTYTITKSGKKNYGGC